MTNEQDTQDKDPVFEAIKDTFKAEMEKENPDEEAVKLAMLMSGAKFANVARYFNQFMVEFGYAKSKEERSEILDELLQGLELTNEEIFDKALKDIEAKLEVNERSASTSLRMWCRKNSIEFFKKPKAEQGEGRQTFESKMQNWMLENMDATSEQFKAFFDENTQTKTSTRVWPYFKRMFDFAQGIKNKYQSA